MMNLKSRQRGFLLNPARFGSGGGGSDAFIRSRAAVSLSASNQDNLTVTMPPTWQVGDRLVCFVAKTGTRVVDTSVSGSNWSEVYSGNATACGMTCLTKIAEGDNTSGLDQLRLTSSTSTGWAASAYAIDNATVVRSQGQNNESGTVVPPSLSLPATAANYVFICGGAVAGAPRTTAPSGYSNIVQGQGGGSGNGRSINTADKFELKGSSESPGEFTPTVGTSSVLVTLAFAPA